METKIFLPENKGPTAAVHFLNCWRNKKAHYNLFIKNIIPIKMKSLKINIYLLTLVMVVIFGCKKTGREGPAGPAGQNGTNGNANVKSQNIVD